MRFTLGALIVLFLTVHIVAVADIHTTIGKRVKNNLQEGVYKTGEKAAAIKQIKDRGDKLKIGVRYYVKEKFNCKKGAFHWLHGKESCVKIHLVIERKHGEKYIMWIPPKGKDKTWMDNKKRLNESYSPQYMFLKIFKLTSTNYDDDDHFSDHYEDLYNLYNADKWWGDGAWLIMNPKLDISGVKINFGGGSTKLALQWANEIWKRYGIKQAYITDAATLMCENKSPTMFGTTKNTNIRSGNFFKLGRLFRLVRVFENKTPSIYNCGGYKNIATYQSPQDVTRVTSARDKLRKMKLADVLNDKNLTPDKKSQLKKIFLKGMTRSNADKPKYFKSTSQSTDLKKLAVSDLKAELTIGEAALAVKGERTDNVACNDYVRAMNLLINRDMIREETANIFGESGYAYLHHTYYMVLLNIDTKSEADLESIYNGYNSGYKPLTYVDKSTAAQENYYNYMDMYDFDNNDGEYHDSTMTLLLIGIVVMFCGLCVCVLVGAVSGFLFAYYLRYYRKQSETIQQ